MTTPVIGEGEKLITTVLLNGERLHVRVHEHACGQNVFDAIVTHLGLNEITYFGLMIIKDGEHEFLSLEEKLSKLSKYAPHLWKDDGSCNSSLVFTVFFRVKYYVENICLLQEQQTRHYYYLQLRKDVLENSIRVHDDTSMVLASYALQAELGDYDKSVHTYDYFIPQHYLPAKTIAKLTIPYIKNALPAMHQSHRGLTESQAEIEFLKEAQKLCEYGILFHRVYKREYSKDIPFCLGICVRGLVVYEDTGPVRNPVCKHPWAKVKKMRFNRSKFIVEAENPNPHHAKMMFCTTNYKRSRYLLRMSQSFYNFQTMMSSKIAMLPEYIIQEESVHGQNQNPYARVDGSINRDAVDNAEYYHDSRKSSHNGRDQSNMSQIKDSGKTKSRPKPEVKHYTVDLVKRDGSFGFTIVGGIELGGIFVKDVSPGGPAAQSRQINSGDCIVQINKDSFENVTRREAINTLRNAPDKSRFIMKSFGKNIIIEGDSSMVTPLADSVLSLAPSNQSQHVPIMHQGEGETEIICVDLARKDGSFGIGFTGGPELGGIYIKSLLTNGAAELDGRIAIGDQIIEIDQTNVESFSRKKIQELLKTKGNAVTIVLERYKQIPSAEGLVYVDREKVLKSNQNFTSITLTKKSDSLGFSITGGLDLGGLFVKYLIPNGPAGQDGRLELGDRVVAVNDISLERATRQRALEIIRNATSPVNLIIEKCVAPGNVANENTNEMGPNMQIVRSDSIKSLPASGIRRSSIGHQSRGMTFSMQHLAHPVSSDINGNHKELLHQSMNESQNNDHNHMQDIFVADLNKVNGSYGLSLTGGPEVGGIYVKAVLPGSAADQDGRVMKGDRVIEINARKMEGLSRQEAIEWLKSCDLAKCVLERFSPSKPNHQYYVQQQQQQQLTQHQQHLHRQHQKQQLQYLMQQQQQESIQHQQQQMVQQQLKQQEIQTIPHPGEQHDEMLQQRQTMMQQQQRMQRHQQHVQQQQQLSQKKQIQQQQMQQRQLQQQHQQEQLMQQKRKEQQEKVQQTKTTHSSFGGEQVSIELARKNGSFGLNLLGGPELRGIFIKNIMIEGPAASSGKIAKGDRLLEINGVRLDGLNRYQANDILKQAQSPATIIIEKIDNPEDVPSLDIDIYGVELPKGDSRFGFSVTGGVELGGIYVKGILPGGSADSTRKIVRGDRLLEVNGVSMEGLTKQQATDLLRKAPQIVNLVLERHGGFDNIVIPESEYFTVDLHKKQTGYGLSLTGGPEIDGVYVKQVQRDSIADQDGRIKKGDRLITINGRNVEEATRQKCTEMLKLSQDIATLHLERCIVGDDLPPLDTVLTVVELNKGDTGFGISLTGGPEIGGIFVKALMPRGAAEKDGRILIGDRVVEMNSVSVDGFTRQQATDLLKNSAPSAIFVLERYKQKKHQIVSSSPALGQINCISEGTSPSSNQHFSFPLYNGAAPYVPPRHHNNGIPSRESAFKRLEQQQMKLAQSQPVSHLPSPVRGNPVPALHNVQGSSVSARIPSLMQRQHSLGMESTHSVAPEAYQEPTNTTLESIPGPYKKNDALTLIETPVRLFMNDNNGTAVDDSPQRFLKQFSKSVASSQSNTIQSRLPIGPISSAIFGNNRDNRNVHELHDLRENPSDIIHEGLRDSAEVSLLTFLGSKTISSSYDSDSKREYRDISTTNSDTVYCLNNGTPSSQSSPQSLSLVNGSPGMDAAKIKVSEPYHSNERSMSDSYHSNEHMKIAISNPITHVGVINPDADKLGSTVAANIYPADKISQNSNNPLTSVNQVDLKKTGLGLKWMSLNDNDKNDKVRCMELKKEEETCIKPNQFPCENVLVGGVRDPQNASVSSQPVTSSTSITIPAKRSCSAPPTSTDIPVPLASKFHSLPRTLQKGNLGGDYIFEVTLFKGAHGLGMNLAGGGSPDNPITIKMIAGGTAADQSGQLRLGDIILEVNGKSVSQLSAKEVISILRACPSEVLLLVRRPGFNHFQQSMPATSNYIGL